MAGLHSFMNINFYMLLTKITQTFRRRILRLHFVTFSLGSPLIDGIFLVQKMCICSCVTLSTTLLMRAVQFNARSACDASTFTGQGYFRSVRAPPARRLIVY